MSTVLRTAIMRIMSEMLDDPDQHGIYPTGRFMDRIEKLLESMMVAPEVLQLSGSEAVYGFVAWLNTANRFDTALENPCYGPTQDATVGDERGVAWAAMAVEFCKASHLTEPREMWTKLVTYPLNKKAA